MKIKKIDPKALAEIKLIVRNIGNGTYKHDQSAIHEEEYDSRGNFCGSAHCVAGWKLVRDLAKKTHTAIKKIANMAGEDINRLEYERLGTDNPLSYAGRAWGLTDSESGDLFSMGTSLEDMQDMIDHWEKGQRLRGRTWEQATD